jgi:hypothetical protein
MKRMIEFATVWTGVAVHGFTCAIAKPAMQACGTSRVSLDWTGAEVNRSSGVPSISHDGRFVCFSTTAALVLSDTNPWFDAYVVDLASNMVELVSANFVGAAADYNSFSGGEFSEDGRFLSFLSLASDIVPGISFGNPNAYVRDRLLGQTHLVSQTAAGLEAGSMFAGPLTPDGRFSTFITISAAVFPGDSNNLPDLFLRDLQAGVTELVSISLTGTVGNHATSPSEPPSLSGDGRYVCFSSLASDLVAGDTNGWADAFRRDRLSGITELVSVGLNAQPGNGQSAGGQCSLDGRFVAFMSQASNLVVGDTNAEWDVFVRDTAAATTTRVSVDSVGSQTNGICTSIHISPCGRFVSFGSTAGGLVPGDTNATWDLFLRDRLTMRTERVSVSSSGAEGDGSSLSHLSLSRNAEVIVFSSLATNLVPNDNNGVTDVFVRRCAVPTSYCTAKVNSLGCVPAMTVSGMPSANAPQAFWVGARNFLNQKTGMLMYSTGGPAATPFQGGTLCIQTPIHRTPPHSTGGSTSGTDCTGMLAFDFNAWIDSNFDPVLVPGQFVWSQGWSRDPGFPPPGNSSLTDAEAFLIWW